MEIAKVVQGSRGRESWRDGWHASYDVVTDDGTQVWVTVKCSGTAEATARAKGNEEGLAAIADSGAALACDLAEKVQSDRGRVDIAIEFSAFDGSPWHHVDYEHQL